MGIKTFLKKTIPSFTRVVRIKPFETSSPEGRSSERHRRIVLSTLTNFLARGLSLVVNLLVVRIVLSRLGREEYGLWVAITAFVVWTTLFDFGLLNGLVNAISEAYGRQDRDALTARVSTAFYSLGALALALMIGVSLLIGRIPWSIVFSTRGAVSDHILQWSVVAAMGPFLVGIPLSVVRQVYAGFQKAYISNIFLVVASFVTLAAIGICVKLKAGLPGLVLASGVGGPIASLLNLGYLIKFDMPWIAPRLSRVSLQAMRRLLKSSVPLFLFQFGALLVNYSQPLLLAHVTNLSTVGDYSLLLRLYGFLGSVIVLSTSSFVPAFREAIERGDRGWVRRNFRRMVGLRLAIVFVFGLLLVFAGNALLHLWLGRSAVRFFAPVWLVLAAVLVVSSWGTAFSDLLTIMDRIWIQVGFVLVNGLATVALTIWLSPRIGVLGALLAYGFAPTLIWSWAGPVVSRPILARDLALGELS